ncbi:peptidoglycan-binding protein [Streptomyces sp. NBC_00435]|uniref:peptidoglycan-binding domain-containing protein n=1 Tax=Streptomyces sp. NBC_00435 TaxID=2903649 RepID=UPI002E1CE722
MPTGPSWPQDITPVFAPARFAPPTNGTLSPSPSPSTSSATAPTPASAPRSASAADRGEWADRAGRAERSGSRLPLVVLALLGLGAAGVLALLLRGPDREPPRTVVPPGLSVPVLPARSPGAGEEPSPDGESAGQADSGASPTPAPTTPGAPPSAGRDPKPTGPTGAQPTPGRSGTLRPGDSGAAVRTLQQRLYAQGFTYVSATGVYDEQTRRGVTQLQQNRSIKGDPPGVYGPATRAAFGSGG